LHAAIGAAQAKTPDELLHRGARQADELAFVTALESLEP
jgi:hypothetical protein